MKHNIKAFVLLITMIFMASSCCNKYPDKILSDNFTATNHLSSQQITSFAEDCRGYIWIGSFGLLQTTKISTHNLTINPEVHLDYDNLEVDFSYTTLGYGVSAPTYQYQMEGFNPGVNTIREAGHAYYSHLPVGKYVFRAKVIGGLGDDFEQTVNV